MYGHTKKYIYKKLEGGSGPEILVVQGGLLKLECQCHVLIYVILAIWTISFQKKYQSIAKFLNLALKFEFARVYAQNTKCLNKRNPK